MGDAMALRLALPWQEALKPSFPQEHDPGVTFQVSMHLDNEACFRQSSLCGCSSKILHPVLQTKVFLPARDLPSYY